MSSREKVFVTGGSRGIGASIAIEFAKAGVDVAVGYYLGEKEADAIVESCLGYGVDAFKLKGNLSSVYEVETIRSQLLQRWNRLDYLINNAGISHYGMFQDVTWDEITTVIDTNVKGTVLVTRAFLDTMLSCKFGRIINISSIWGVYGGSYEVIYSLSKGAINAFTQALAKELEGTEVTVNAIAPGAVQTRMMADLSDEDLEYVKNDIPLGRLAKPEEISKLVFHLCKKESKLLNGQILLVHGAWHQ